MSGAARDGWAIKGPDGVLRYVGRGNEDRPRLTDVVPWNVLLDADREAHDVESLLSTRGWAVVPVRLVEIDDEKEGC